MKIKENPPIAYNARPIKGPAIIPIAPTEDHIPIISSILSTYVQAIIANDELRIPAPPTP